METSIDSTFLYDFMITVVFFAIARWQHCALNLASKTLISDYTTAYSATRLFSAMMYY